MLLLSTQLSLYVSLTEQVIRTEFESPSRAACKPASTSPRSPSAQGLDPFTVPTTAGLDTAAPADSQIINTAFEVICDCAVQGVQLTVWRLYRWADAQGPGGGAAGRGPPR